jgi:predicted HTH transcriptional regulator
VLSEALDVYVDPELDFKIQTTRIRRRRDVIVVTVPESKRKPHYLVSKEKPGSRTAFVRVDDRTVAASKELRRLLRTEDSDTGVHFEFGNAEHALMRYLDRYHTITLPQFSRLAQIPMHRASRSLVLLTRAGIVDLQPGEDLDTYTLSAEKRKTPRPVLHRK